MYVPLFLHGTYMYCTYVYLTRLCKKCYCTLIITWVVNKNYWWKEIHLNTMMFGEVHTVWHSLLMHIRTYMHTYIHTYSAWNKNYKLVSHSLKVGNLYGLLMASPLKMYSNFCSSKLNLLGQIPEMVRKWPMANSYFKLCTYIHTYTHIYIAIYIYTHTHICIYIHIVLYVNKRWCDNVCE